MCLDYVIGNIIVLNLFCSCGKVETGSFLDGGAPNGLLGLGLDKISLPSMLSSQKVAADSFSMCFGADGLGRITFGDKGSSNQKETPLNLRKIKSVISSTFLACLHQSLLF